ncbi:PTS glucose transporter subunit IIA [Paratractidigestivibacter sp.]|uniref:PTS sugar transporter subunit IIA n=1 Tax=Paratractidigestivibacter sp. TaxID=2847316 RepID=UPI002ABDEA5F|nr:PTS glucose transporter subunit IIA [Paratractidigestivibacter sp.]
MGLLDSLFAPSRPEAVAAEGRAGSIYAPATGEVVPLSQVSDPVFSQGMLGEGLAVRPASGVAYAPVSGAVTSVVASKHAVALRAEGGAEVLLHVGVDTVRLRGKGFTCFVDKGDPVTAGDALISFDQDQISGSGLDDTVIVTVTNSGETGPVRIICADSVRAGEPMLEISPRAYAGER